MNVSTRLSRPYLFPAQSQKHVTVNESLRKLDAIVQLSAVSASTTAEPGAPDDGDVYILPPGKTGTAWGPMSNGALAYYVDGAWMQIAPREGWLAFVADTGAFLVYTGGDWRALARERLAANRTYFVSTTGDDGNDGLSAGSPFATIQKAFDTVVETLDTAGFTVTIQLANGTYTNNPLIVGSSWSGGGPLVIRGDPATPANVVWAQTASGHVIDVIAGLPAPITLTGLTMQTSGSGGVCVLLRQTYGKIVIGEGCVFGAAVAGHLFLTGGGATVLVTHSYTISGGAPTHVTCLQQGQFICTSGITVTLTGTPAFGTTSENGFARVNSLGHYQPSGVTFSGAATGRRYFVGGNGVISTSGAGATFLPGDAAGASASGGEYI